MEAIVRNEKIKLPDRIIGHIKGINPGATVVFFGGIHGNEPAGIKALEQVFAQLKSWNIKMNGTLYGFRGNVKALELEKRFLESDLNRIWQRHHITSILRRDKEFLRPDEQELLHIYNSLSKILLAEQPPYYFLDLHTTSSHSKPFITISDAMINRKFATLFNVPIVLGLEEYLQGTLLNYINERGYVSLGFEAGQHQDESAVQNCVEFIWKTLLHTELISRKDFEIFQNFKHNFNECSKPCFYEVTQRFKIEDHDNFSMKKGFLNFSKIQKGEHLASYNQTDVISKKRSILFMPLYQKQGNDGFFIIRRIPMLALKISAFLRQFKLYQLLILFPGISWTNKEKETLMVNKKIARFYIKSIFHLMGYRKYFMSNTYFFMSNREKRAKNHLYKKCKWY
ncbi:MAG: succinylglutamate desuccinylase/aspartoacylase family protein [Bacteroidetes bacterium]|nr:succinylglutamate desuccinylase/aspartoacylase family protein [Bacteroidota bacterium]